MTERVRRVEESITLFGEKTRVLPPTPLNELGIVIPEDKLGLVGEKVTVGLFYNSITGEKIYIVISHHPFLGMHLADLLNTVSPNAGPLDLTGTATDWRMPYNARKKPLTKSGQESTMARLHRIHEQDPFIGPVYKQFDQLHRKKLLSALNNEHQNGMSMAPRLITFVENGLDGIFQNYIARIKDASTRDWYEVERFVQLALVWRGTKPLVDFLRTRPEFPPRSASPTNFIDRVMPYRGGTVTKANTLLDFFNTPGQDEKRELALLGLDIANRIFVDVKQQAIWQPTILRWGKQDLGLVCSFSNEGRLVVNTIYGGDTLYLEIQSSPDGYKLETDKYEFSRGSLQYGLYPVFGWEKDSAGKRQSLSQEMAESLLHKINFPRPKRADVMLGACWVAYFSPAMKEKWSKTMKVRHGAYDQTMMAAQMPVFVWLPPHLEQLLSDENNFCISLERAVEDR